MFFFLIPFPSFKVSVSLSMMCWGYLERVHAQDEGSGAVALPSPPLPPSPIIPALKG